MGHPDKQCRPLGPDNFEKPPQEIVYSFVSLEENRGRKTWRGTPLNFFSFSVKSPS